MRLCFKINSEGLFLDYFEGLFFLFLYSRIFVIRILPLHTYIHTHLLVPLIGIKKQSVKTQKTTKD
jgi:hypothetical protein